MEAEKTKGRTWNGYACPGCRTVFRVAADFIGADVACPACKETLRLPKTPDEVPPPIILPEKPKPSPQPLAAFARAQPAQPADRPHEPKPSVLRAMLSSSDGRLKLALALLLPMAVIAGGLLLFPPGESTPEKTAQEAAPLPQPETAPQEKPAPPPPPVAVSEMPDPPPPSLPEPQVAPAPEVAVVQPVPEPTTPVAEPPAGQVESAPPIPAPAPAPEPVATANDPDHGLVEAIPVESAPAPVPAPEKPAPPPAAPPEPETTAAPVELVHNVVRGDTLSGISRKYLVEMNIIKKANGMRNDIVMLGQKLKIPGGIKPAAEPEAPKAAETPAPAPQAPRSHTVVRGDTLERIARKYGVSPQQVMQANGMKNDVVRLGRKLVIPAAP